MARTLIGLEEGLYREAGLDPGPDWRSWRVVARQEETSQVASFELLPADGGAAPGFRPGQYVSVAVTLPDGARQIRQYSLSSAPERATQCITVKRMQGNAGPDGEVSTWLHANVGVGDVLSLSAPFGNAVLDTTDAPLFLASAGIGCAPVISILDHLALTGDPRRVTVVHADRSIADHALREQMYRTVSRLADAQAHVWYECPHPGWPMAYTGRADLSRVTIADNVQAYVCGPPPFIDAVRAHLTNQGVPRSRIRHELFGPELVP
jgi:nitric oxide dioxygenase